MKVSEDDIIDVSDHGFDIPAGDSNQVLALAAFQNLGKAIADNDIYPDGTYLLHKFPGVFQMFVIKEGKKDYTFVTQVNDEANRQFMKGLEQKRHQFENKGNSEDGVVYDVPIWVVFELAMNVGVHPTVDEAAFDKALWDYFPDLWIDKGKAPRHNQKFII